LMRRMLAILAKSLPPDHFQVSIALNNLAELLQATNRHREAEPLIRRALAIDEKNFGPRHPHVAICLNNLALLLKATNRLGEAVPLSRRHVQIFLEFKQRTGHEHPHLRDGIANYTRLLEAMGMSPAEIAAEMKELMREVVSTPQNG
jgi:tetratricopeptide (TPR) repeat protein